MTSSTSTLICVSFRRKLLDNCSLFHNLVLIPIIAENPISHMYETNRLILRLPSWICQ
ncbi:hypothetical protein T12_5602 [Trichinella patagoniensis]|uniref:Uncharacterized protein n=1 Tax=Trichinella patagoniensis TaxID=990121 RepID=A0A0V0YVP2_9BILA|nr:hypothetical protein T12_5602 [Trichinella patagoniensis]